MQYSGFKSISVFHISLLCFRFIGSTKISLKDLAAGQTKSLPSRNIPLANESGQNIGVSIFLYESKNLSNRKTSFFFLKKSNNRPANHFLPGYNQPRDWLWSSSQCCTKPQWPSGRRCHSGCWYVSLILSDAVQCSKGLLVAIHFIRRMPCIWSSCFSAH